MTSDLPKAFYFSLLGPGFVGSFANDGQVLSSLVPADLSVITCTVLKKKDFPCEVAAIISSYQLHPSLWSSYPH